MSSHLFILPQRWGEPFPTDPGLTETQREQFIAAATRQWPQDPQKELRYWLTCRGYYYIDYSYPERPVYVGSIECIPRDACIGLLQSLAGHS